MNVLFIHNNFPGQYKHLANLIAQNPKNKVVAIGRTTAPIFKVSNPKITSISYKIPREITPKMHHYLRNMESCVLSGQEVAKILFDLKKKGFVPDLTFAHIGWGEVLYFKDVFPGKPLIGYTEFYYHSKGADVGFDPEYPITVDDELRIRTRNSVSLLSMVDCDALVSPTNWQKNLFPKEFLDKISVIHEGIDISQIKADPKVSFTLPNGKVLKKTDEVVTFTSRSLEPYRGFHIFMRAVEEICKRRPNCHILLTGDDDVSYGRKAPEGQTYRSIMLEKVKIDPERVHFLGRIPYDQHLKMLQVSSAHVYLTYPFVLSWSFLEAMASECVLIGSDTTPVTEVLENEHNGLLVNFFDFKQIADTVDRVMTDPKRMRHLGKAARQDVQKKYGLQLSLDQYANLINNVLKAK